MHLCWHEKDELRKLERIERDVQFCAYPPGIVSCRVDFCYNEIYEYKITKLRRQYLNTNSILTYRRRDKGGCHHEIASCNLFVNKLLFGIKSNPCLNVYVKFLRLHIAGSFYFTSTHTNDNKNLTHATIDLETFLAMPRG